MNEPENIILQYLRRFDERQGRFEGALREFGARLTSLERWIAATHSDLTNHRDELEGIKDRLNRVERRLDLNDPQH